MENALIIGNGELADFLYRKISNNPWFGERVVGCVCCSTKPTQRSGPRAAGAARAWAYSALDEIVAQHAIRTVYLVTPLGGSEVINDIYLKLLENALP
jgi:putative colanic acid biosynthesis UDP-glucose lipid carrier transferase